VEVDWQGGGSDTDDGEVPKNAGHLGGHRQRGVDRDQVEDEFGALPAGQVFYAANRVVAGQQPFVGAKL
jgi:hypothetical protein